MAYFSRIIRCNLRGSSLLCVMICLVASPLFPGFSALAATPPILPTGSAGVETITPTRVLDSRTANSGYNKLPFNAGETRVLPILGQGAVPLSGVSAIYANVTVVVGNSGGGYLTIFPSGQARPLASNINFAANTVVANQVLVPLGADGSISIYSYAANVHVIVDVSGWVGKGPATTGGATTAIQPNRILDSRGTNGGRNGVPLHGNETAQIPVLGTHDLPSTGVSAIVANVTVVPDSISGGYITAYAAGSARPLASTVNLNTGVVTANMALIPVGPDGSIMLYCGSGTMHVVIDIQGLVKDGDPAESMGVKPIQAHRVLDSRTAVGGRNGVPLGHDQSFSVPVTGVGGVPSTGVGAVIAHVVAVGPTSNGGYFTAYSTGYARPLASSLNFKPGMTASNDVVIPIGADGTVSIYNYNISGTTHAILDIQGWIASPNLTSAAPSVQFNTAGPTAADSQKAQQILANANRYAMTGWWDGPAQTLLAYDLGPATANHDAVRRLGMQALSLSTSLATGVYDEATAGVSPEVAKQRTIQMINRVASQHVTNRLGGWGNSWQSGMWAGIAGRAAWYIWADLPVATQNNVARMVSHEANYVARVKIHYLRDAAGNVLTSGDSGAEEVSWNATAIQVALVMMPNHPRTNIWLTELARLSLASWARPQDVTSPKVFNGAPLSAWLKGSNVESNGIIINHNRVASDYSTTTYQNLDAAPLFALADKQTPRAVVGLLAPVYAAFRGVTFSEPTYLAPGGQTYVTNSAAIYYPQSNDWGTGQKLPYALSDAQALVYGYDPGTANQYLLLHEDAQLAMQARFTDGRTYDLDVPGTPNAEYNYEGREEHTAQLASQLYLTLYMRDNGLVSFTDDSYWQ